jgi:hypothetical protein
VVADDHDRIERVGPRAKLAPLGGCRCLHGAILPRERIPRPARAGRRCDGRIVMHKPV